MSNREAMTSPAQTHVADQPATTKTADIFARMKKWIKGATGVVILVPPLIIGVKNIYGEFVGSARAPQEIVNAKNFETYEPDDAVHEKEMSWNGNQHPVKVEVFEGGKILVRYGVRSQWFESPENQLQTPPEHSMLDFFVSVLNVFVSTSNAQGVPAETPTLIAKRSVMTRAIIEYEAYYNDGTLKTKTVDKRTGNWSRPKTGQWTEIPEDAKKIE